ncbi:MAG: hypothetical protein ACLRNQ_21695 [Flavonifractor plautii]
MTAKTYFEELSYALRRRELAAPVAGGGRPAPGGVERPHPVPGHGERRRPV